MAPSPVTLLALATAVPPHKLVQSEVADYARRKNMPVAEIERWLAPVLAYEPEAEPMEAATAA